jgi:phospholipid/cholesterol/gamma-HCH transport system substrate-binding protein
MTRPMRLLAVAVVVVVLAGVAVALLGPGSRRTATLYFPEARSLYVDDDVTVLGLTIGDVTAITPEPGRVKVEISYDADQPIPADVKGAIVSPGLVSVRSLALAPAYAGGPTLEDGAVIPESRTAVPVEWDEVKAQLTNLTSALGPKGANSDGALSHLLDTSAKNLDGQGDNLNQTLRALSEAMSTLSDGRGDLFATVRNLQTFTAALRQSDDQVRSFNQNLAGVSGFLAQDRDELGAALDGLDRAFGDIQTFLADNRGTLSATVQDLQPVADLLADNRQQFADLLQVAPTTASNFYGIYDPIIGDVSGALSTANVEDLQLLVCSTVLNLGSPQACDATFGPLLDKLSPSVPPVGANVVERNGRSNQVVSKPGPVNPPYTAADERREYGTTTSPVTLVDALEQQKQGGGR